MLDNITIKNYLLIDDIKLDFDSKFSVITGETGAGKSILLGAIGLLTGNRADSSMVRPHSDKCIIEAEFTELDKYVVDKLVENDIEVADNECIIRREITNKGKSRSFVNDIPVTLSLLKDIGEHLVDIHSQHKNLLLGNTLFQLSILDLYSNNKKLLEEYKGIFNMFRNKSRELDALKTEVSEKAKERDYIEYQLNKLLEASIVNNEEVELEKEYNMLSHSQEIKEGLINVLVSLDNDEYGAVNSINSAINSISSIRTFSDNIDDVYNRTNSVLIELKDIIRVVSKEEDNTTFDPIRLDEINNRLDTINELLLRHNVSNTSELIRVQNEFEEKLTSIDNGDSIIQDLIAEVEKLNNKLIDVANKLHFIRVKSIKDIENILIENLKELGMPHIRLKINIEKLDTPTINGIDKVEILFSANKDMDLEPVSEIASGGEISRLMLCIKALVAEKRSLPTIIFDEIDTGVSGDIADKIGIILGTMGRTMQVMAVTHLPQIAAHGNNHIYIYKEHNNDTTKTIIKELDDAERIEEIARMQSGNNITKISLAAAKELILKAQNDNV